MTRAEEIAALELECGLRRKPPTWQEEVQAIARIHELFVKDDPKWTQKQTAHELGMSPTTLSEKLAMADYINPKSPNYNPEIEQFCRFSDAICRIRRNNDREGEKIISELLCGTTLPPPAPKVEPMTDLDKFYKELSDPAYHQKITDTYNKDNELETKEQPATPTKVIPTATISTGVRKASKQAEARQALREARRREEFLAVVSQL